MKAWHSSLSEGQKRILADIWRCRRCKAFHTTTLTLMKSCRHALILSATKHQHHMRPAFLSLRSLAGEAMMTAVDTISLKLNVFKHKYNRNTEHSLILNQLCLQGVLQKSSF